MNPQHDPRATKSGQTVAETPGDEAGINPYLWDGSGAADPAIVELEQALKARRFDASPAALRRGQTPVIPGGLVARGRVWLALAACVVLMVIAFQIAARRSSPASPSAGPSTQVASWAVESIEGLPKIGARGLEDHSRLAADEWLTTDANSRASLSAAAVGRVTIEPNSRLRVVKAGEKEHRLELAAGTMHAFITAPPRIFVVDTPAARALDMGCVYDLTVDPDGLTHLRVTLGWVELSGKKWSSRVPAGYECRSSKNAEPQIPRRAEASAELAMALDRVWKTQTTSAPISDVESAIDSVLRLARPQDSPSVWHLLERTSGMTRQRVAAALAQLAPLPEGVTLDGVAAGDTQMLEKWWDQIRWTL